ncbi:MAG: hypothetical protein ABH847_04190 [Candidatus Omnitrophota bacterium]
MKCFIVILTVVILLIPPSVAFALPYFEPLTGSFQGTTTLTNGGANTAGISAWSWLQDISGAIYTYFAYQILDISPPYTFSPYIGYFSVTNASGVSGEITGSATSNAGVNPWFGISFPSNSDWIALGAEDLIYLGQYSSQGTQSKANNYYEYAILGSRNVGLVNANVSGGGTSAYGQVYGAIGEINSFILFGCGAVGLSLTMSIKRKKVRRIINA